MPGNLGNSVAAPLVAAFRGEPMLVGYTAPVPGQGTTTVAAAAAAELSKNLRMRILRIGSGSSGKPVLQRGTADAGLPDVLNGSVPLAGILPDPATGRIPFLPLESPSDTPVVKLFSAETMGHFRQQAAALFDVVVFDLPPPDGVSSTLLLARHLDLVFLVLRAGRIRAAEARTARVKLQEAGTPPAGVILNDVRHPMFR